MKCIKKSLLRLASVLFLVAPVAQANSPGAHNETTPLPVNGMMAAVKNGKLAFVSSNGRFVFQGKVYDVWNGKDLETLDDVRHAYNYMNLKKLDFRADMLKPYVVGNGAKEVIGFFDPYCPSCHLLIEDARKESEYTFKFIPIPVMGDASIKAIRFAFCSADKEKAEEILMGKVKPENLPDDEFPDCDTTAIAKRVVTTQILGLQGVPFMVRDDGLVRSGYIKGDLNKWLKAGK